MFQLLKYEIMKKWKIFIYALFTLFLAEGYILYQFLVKSNWEFAMAIFGLLGSFGLLFILIDSIYSYSQELNNKTGYMLFLTPRSGYQILGAKIIISFVELLIGFIIYMFLVFINYEILMRILNEGSMDFYRMLFELLNPTIDTVYIVLSPIFAWFTLIIVAFFSITLSTTFLAQRKFKGIISFILFILIFSVSTRIVNTLQLYFFTTPNLSEPIVAISSSLLYLFIGIIIYFISSILLDKHISL
jgi:hypothetical protein